MQDYVDRIRAQLASRLTLPLDTVEDMTLTASCALEYAAVHARDRHILKVGPSASDYAVFCVLAQALTRISSIGGRLGVTMTISSSEEKGRFVDLLTSDKASATVLRDDGPAAFAMFAENVRTSVVTQCSNQVVEMLVNDLVRARYAEARDCMKSFLCKSAVQGAAMGRSALLEVLPAKIVDASRLMNLAYAMQAGEICGERFVDAYSPMSDEIDGALDLYGIYMTARDSMTDDPCIGMAVVRQVLERLGLTPYAHLEIRPVE